VHTIHNQTSLKPESIYRLSQCSDGNLEKTGQINPSCYPVIANLKEILQFTPLQTPSNSDGKDRRRTLHFIFKIHLTGKITPHMLYLLKGNALSILNR